LGCFDDKVLAIGHAYCEVVREEVKGKALAVRPGDVVPDDTSDGGRNADGAEL